MKYANPNVAENLSNGFFVKLDPSTKVIDPVTHAKNKQPVKYRGVYGVRNLTVPFSVNARFKFKPGQSTPEVTTVHTMPVDNFLFNAAEVSKAITAQIKHCATTLHPDINEMLNWNVKLESNSLYNPLTGVTMAHVENAKIKDFIIGKAWSREEVKKLAVDIWSLRCGLVKEIEIYAGIMLKYNVYGELTQYEMSADDYLDKVADVVLDGPDEQCDEWTPFGVDNECKGKVYEVASIASLKGVLTVKSNAENEDACKALRQFERDVSESKTSIVEVCFPVDGVMCTRYATVTGYTKHPTRDGDFDLKLANANASDVIAAQMDNRIVSILCCQETDFEINL